MTRDEAKMVIKQRGGLRPCPFCGGKASLRPKVITDDLQEFYIKCTRCHASSMRSVLLLNVVDAWNARSDNRSILVIPGGGGKKWAARFKKLFK